MTDITELAQRVERIISDIKLKHGVKDTYAPVMKWDEFLELVEALEKAQQRITQLESRTVKLPKTMRIEGGAYCSAHAYYDSNGDYYDRADVVEMLVAEGIKVEAE